MGTQSARISIVFTLGILTVALVGCAGEDRFADIREFMRAVEQSPGGRIAPLPEFEAYRAFTYNATDRRSPFEPSPAFSLARGSSAAGKPGTGSPQDRARQYLEKFPLAALTMVGNLQKSDVTFALVRDSQGGIHRVGVGDYIGDQWGQVESIGTTHINIVETTGDGTGGWLRTPQQMTLKGKEPSAGSQIE